MGRPDTYGLPDLNINGNAGFQLGYRCNCPLDEREFIYDYVANFTLIRGNHSIKFGATYEHAGNLPTAERRSPGRGVRFRA